MKTIKEINTLPDDLTPEAELELLRLGDSEKVILHSLKSAVRYASAIDRGRLPLDELLSISGMGLTLAARNYVVKPNDNVPFLRYAKPYIRGQLYKAWRIRNPVEYGAEIPERQESEQLEDTPAGDPSGPFEFERIDLKEKLELIRPHFDKLSEVERRVLILQFESRLTGAQVGEMIGCSRANIRECRIRALKKIRNALMDERKYYV